MKPRCVMVLLVLLGACGPLQRETPSAEFIGAAVAFLDDLQPRSIGENREYCGYFGYDASGRFIASPPVRGGADYCDLDIDAQPFDVVASYHTHAAFDTVAENEVPSDADLLSDIGDGVFGFVATPGGRIWMLDPRARDARQICGIGCVSSDPEFVEGDAGPIARHYTLRELKQRF